MTGNAGEKNEQAGGRMNARGMLMRTPSPARQI